MQFKGHLARSSGKDLLPKTIAALVVFFLFFLWASDGFSPYSDTLTTPSEVSTGVLSQVSTSSQVSSSGSYPFATKATACKYIRPQELKKNPYLSSQMGEDYNVFMHFNGLCGGTYLEMGAVDGIDKSNTYLLHKANNWKGLLIELSPPSYEALVKNRPDDVTVNAAVCDKARTLHYWYNPDRKYTAGVWEFTTSKFRRTYWKGVTLEKTTPVDCRPLSDIIRKDFNPKGYTYIDFWSLDVEGAELVALQSVDWSTTAFGLIVMEASNQNLRKDLSARLLLEEKGYTYLYKDAMNEWYVNKHFHEIYKNFPYGD